MRFIFIVIVLTSFHTINSSNPFYYIGQPSFYQHQFTPVSTYTTFQEPYTSTFFGNPHFNYVHRSIPTPYVTPISPIIQKPAPIVHHKTIFTQSDNDYRGYAYQTKTDNGATSHVLFVTGPQAQMFKSPIFSDYSPQKMVVYNNEANKAKNIASNMVDSSNKNNQQSGYTYQVPTRKLIEPMAFIQDFFRRNNQGTVNLYSKNNDLFADYPADDFSRQIAINPVESRFGIDSNDSTISSPVSTSTSEKSTPVSIANTDIELIETITTTEKIEAEIPEESIMINTKLRLNELIRQMEKNEESATVTIQTTPSQRSNDDFIIKIRLSEMDEVSKKLSENKEKTANPEEVLLTEKMITEPYTTQKIMETTESHTTQKIMETTEPTTLTHLIGSNILLKSTTILPSEMKSAILEIKSEIVTKESQPTNEITSSEYTSAITTTTATENAITTSKN